MTSTAPVAESLDSGQPGKLPRPRGLLSKAVIEALERDPSETTSFPAVPEGVDALGGDVQLALYVCYELHYRGFLGVDDEWEWNTDLLALRAQLERQFLSRIRSSVEEGFDAEADMDEMSVEPRSGTGPSWYLRDRGTWEQMREYLANRSLYHLKEADPHAWAIPRLTGKTKASFVAVEFDEYGAGRADRMHQRLYVEAMHAAGMDTGYLAYIDDALPEMLAIVNLMSLFGLHRSLRGAVVGHFAATEITSSPGAARLVTALKRLDAPPECVHFYVEHVEADAVHEQILRHDVVGSLVSEHPELETDVVFGMRALTLVENRFADALMDRWTA